MSEIRDAPPAVAWRVGRVAALGGGGATAAAAVFTGVLVGQAMIARRTIPAAEAPPPRCDGRYRPELSGEPLRMVMLGDSSAAGYGVDTARHTPGALLAAGLAERLGRPVLLRCFAVVGAESGDLPPQVEQAVELAPQIAVIIIGGNDVTHRRRLRDAVGNLVTAVQALRAAGAEVVVGTCPDLGTIRPIQPPLRWMARRWSRQLAAAQTVAVVEAGGRTVSLGDLIGPAFSAEPDRMFSWDRFHPSADGYAAAASALLPTVVAAVTPAAEPAGALGAGEGVRVLPDAATEAAGRAGTEVSRASVAGRERGPGGRWAQLRRRVWQRTEHPTEPAANGWHVRLPAESHPQPRVHPEPNAYPEPYVME
jgi:lysophospholipase L1-like esterase